MTWGNPPPFKPDPPKIGKKITPEQLAGDTEHSQQVALFCWASQNVGKYQQLAFMFAVPNGFFGDAGQKAKMKAEGLRDGVCDVFLPAPMASYFGLFIEMKIEKYRNRANSGCSDAQIEFIDNARSNGYAVKVCYNWIEARDFLIAYMEGRL